MKPRVKRAVGIDIGSRRVSVALVERTAEGFNVVASATGDLSAGAAGGQAPAPEKALSRALRKLGTRVRGRGRQVAVAASTRSAMMCLLDLPRQMPANIGDFVHNELRQYVALSGRSVSSDFCGIGSGARKRLLAVAADAEELGRTLSACRVAGVSVGSVEPAALACLRAFLAGERDGGRCRHALIAVLGRDSLVVCVVCKGTLDFVRVRDMPIGMEGRDAMRAWLTEELNAVVTYYGSDASGDSARWRARLVLHDAPCSKAEISPLVALAPEMESLEVVDCSEPDEVGQSEENSTPPCTVAVGAALKLLDLAGDELRVDLTPQEVIQARSTFRRTLIGANVAAAAFIVFFLAVQLLARTNDVRSRRIEQARIAEELPMMSALVQEDKYLDREIAQMQEQLDRLKTMRMQRKLDWPTALERIWQARPAGVGVSQIACDDNRTLVVKGTAPSPVQTKAFVQNLDEGGPFESVWLSHVQQRPENGDVTSFEINCAVRSMN